MRRRRESNAGIALKPEHGAGRGHDARRPDGRSQRLHPVAAHGLTRPMFDGVLDERYEALIEDEIRRAEAHFERAADGVRMLAPAAGSPVLAAEDSTARCSKR